MKFLLLAILVSLVSCTTLQETGNPNLKTKTEEKYQD